MKEVWVILSAPHINSSLQMQLIYSHTQLTLHQEADKLQIQHNAQESAA